MDKKLNLDNPKTFNEKLQWLKLYDRKPEYTKMVDKYEAKKYIADLIGEEYVIPTLGVYDKFEDIDFSKLPNQFVIKCTHDSGGLVICKDKAKLNVEEAREKINKSLKRKYYKFGREWPYKNVKPRIIIEKYMEDDKTHQLIDYKIFNFNGMPKYIQLDFNRFQGHQRQMFDIDWKECEFMFVYKNIEKTKIDKPNKLKEMIELAKILSKDIPFLRTDFYIVNEKVYIGELTFYPESGFGKFTPEEWDLKLGNMLDVSKVSK